MFITNFSTTWLMQHSLVWHLLLLNVLTHKFVFSYLTILCPQSLNFYRLITTTHTCYLNTLHFVVELVFARQRCMTVVSILCILTVGFLIGTFFLGYHGKYIPASKSLWFPNKELVLSTHITVLLLILYRKLCLIKISYLLLASEVGLIDQVLQSTYDVTSATKEIPSNS